LKFMTLRTRAWGAGKLLLLGGALLLTYVLFAVATMRVALRTRDVTVPPLVGKTVNDATAALTTVGLNLKVEEGRRMDAKVPAGEILAQDPQPGASTRRERSVKVWVSSGPRATVVPALIGESERTAQLRLQQDGLELAAVSEVRSGEYATDAVIAQTPPPKSSAPRVALLVNHGERGATYVMPDLIGVNAIAPPTCCVHTPSGLRWSAIIPTPASPPASSCGRTRRQASRSLPASPFRSR
jgi:beta-lactam-binding protein with PASTA domain